MTELQDLSRRVAEVRGDEERDKAAREDLEEKIRGLIPAPDVPMEPREVTAFGVAILTGALLLFTQLIALWPVVVRATDQGTGGTVQWLFGLAPVFVAPEAALLILAALVGGLASLAEESFRFVLEASRKRGGPPARLSWFFVLRPVQGALLALIVFFALRGGLVSSTASTTTLNVYGVAAYSGLVGLFTRQAFQRLRKIFEAMFVSQADPM